MIRLQYQNQRNHETIIVSTKWWDRHMVTDAAIYAIDGQYENAIGTKIKTITRFK